MDEDQAWSSVDDFLSDWVALEGLSEVQSSNVTRQGNRHQNSVLSSNIYLIFGLFLAQHHPRGVLKCYPNWAGVT